MNRLISFLFFCLFIPAHSGKNPLDENHQFRVMRKYQSKFDCLIFEMVFIRKPKPNNNYLNIQMDAILPTTNYKLPVFIES